MQIVRLVTAIFFLFTSVLALAQTLRPSDFALLDQYGKFHQLSRYSENEAVVVVVFGSGDPASALAAESLSELKTNYRDESVQFFLLNADVGVNRSALESELDALGIDLPVLIDSAQVVVRALGLTQLTQAAIIDPSSHEVLYRGPMESTASSGATPYLDNSLRALLSGARADLEELPMGDATAIVFPYQNEIEANGLSYQEDIAPIFLRRCARCHVDNGLAPWAMSSHRMLQGWSPMVREVLLTKRMPPGQIDMAVGEWSHINEIDDNELAKLIAWIDAGARREGDDDPMVREAAALPEWALGEPDLILEVPEQKVPATGVVDFRFEYSELGLSEDKWLRAVAYDVGDQSVLHSLMVYALKPGISKVDTLSLVHPSNAEFISIYVPGRGDDEFSADSGFLLEKGHDLAFKIRYVSSGRETQDSTRIGLYFRDKPKMQVHNIPVFRDDLAIRAGEPNYQVVAQSSPIEQDAYIEAVAPQMHGRGVSMRLFVRNEDSARTPIINVANYNFNWQFNYQLRERMLVPAGSVLEAETSYDNSSANVYNPDPEADARYGVTTWDEILSHYVRTVSPIID